MKTTRMKNIAIIDDDVSGRAVLKGLLHDAGFSVMAEGKNGNDAVEICRTKQPDLVIMDVKMPGKDGVEAAMEINRTCPVPVVFLTGRDDNETIEKAIDAGVMAYLAKPVRAEELIPAIKLAFSRFIEFEILKKENQDLRNTLQTRKSVERAKGILMEKEGLSESEAFSRIRKISMDKRRSMADIAGIIITAFEEKK